MKKFLEDLEDQLIRENKLLKISDDKYIFELLKLRDDNLQLTLDYENLDVKQKISIELSKEQIKNILEFILFNNKN